MSSGIKINRYIVQTFINLDRELQVKYTIKKDSQAFYSKVYKIVITFCTFNVVS